MRRGFCDAPTHENYILGMIGSINGFYVSELIGSKFGSLLKNLRADPDLLKDEVWQLFQIEGQGELTLAAHDKYLGGKSADYSLEPVLSRNYRSRASSRAIGLLDESLEALNRGFSQFRVAWFSQFHEIMEPTVKERRKRQKKYLVLLASPIPPTVTFALDALDVIDKEKPIPAANDDRIAPAGAARQTQGDGQAGHSSGSIGSLAATPRASPLPRVPRSRHWPMKPPKYRRPRSKCWRRMARRATPL